VECRQHPRSAVAKAHRAINRVMNTLNEKSRRRFAGVLALQWGHGGVQRVQTITGLSRNTICRGRHEVQQRESASATHHIRRAGGGRPSVEKNIPTSLRS